MTVPVIVARFNSLPRSMQCNPEMKVCNQLESHPLKRRSGECKCPTSKLKRAERAMARRILDDPGNVNSCAVPPLPDAEILNVKVKIVGFSDFKL
jgi:hypothetical protein